MKRPLFLRRLVRRLGERFAKPEPAGEGFGCDPEWYLLAYPEAKKEIAAGKARDAGDHYRRLGASRGYDPNVWFAESWYLGRYPDVADGVRRGVYSCGFEHYVLGGRGEGRQPNPLWIDEASYCLRYPDVAPGVADGRFRTAGEHYLRAGAREGRDPHQAFAERWYLDRYPDVGALVAQGRFLCGYQHFMERGLAEARQPHPHYDERHYRALQPDVDAEIRAGRLAYAYLHLVPRGLQEGRSWRYDEVRQNASRIARCRLEEFLAADDVLEFDPPELPEVSVLLVLFHRAELTLQCLQALRQSREVTLEIIIVDNGSTDPTREMLDRLRGVRILLNEENRGFTRAANQAAGSARGEYLLFLNNDTEVLPSAIRSAVARLRGTPGAGAVGGRIVGLDGRLQEAGSIVWRNATTEGYGRGDDPLSGAYRFPREVDYCSGVFLLTPREIFERLGGFDLRFTPAYYEESDYCFRLRREGLRVIYDPGSVVIHHEAASLPDESHLIQLLAKNRPVFAQIHREALAEACEADVRNFFPASNRQRFGGRILLLDDHIPLERMGGGSPRLQELIHILCSLDLFVTFFATHPKEVDWREVRREFPETHLEWLNHLDRRGFGDFWERRREHYDFVVVSRQHNFRELLKSGFDPAAERARVIYDAEAVVARRRARQREVLGPDAPSETEIELAEEIELARSAPEVWAVSEEEGRLLAGPGQRLAIIAHAAKGEPGQRGFDQRRGILFVGRFEEEWNPNVDALRWYLGEIHPRLVERLGEGAALSVVGEVGNFDFPAAADVRFLGCIPELAPIYDQHRLFVAPTRFAAGIPHKVTGAATHGLPVVATSLLAHQLGWHHGVELLDGGDNDPERFATQVASLYTRKDTWHTLRSNALQRVRREHSREALRKALIRALDPENG